MHAARRSAFVLLFATLLAQAGCSGGSSDAPPAPHVPTFTITGVGWYEENIDPSFWTTPPADGQTAFYDFFVHYEGDITFADLQSVRMYGPGGMYWNLLPDETFLDTADKVIGGWGRWYHSTATHQLPIGELLVEVRLADGRVFTSTKNVPAPGSTTAGSFTWMHTENLVAPPPNSAPMVRRATLAPGTLDAAGQTLSLTFSVNDGLVFNGWAWVYDAAGTYLGSSALFRDPTTGAPTSLVGGAFHTDGTPNSLTVRAADLQLLAGASFSQIAKVRVMLVDGQQYGLGGGGWDCGSISGSVALTPQ